MHSQPEAENEGEALAPGDPESVGIPGVGVGKNPSPCPSPGSRRERGLVSRDFPEMRSSVDWEIKYIKIQQVFHGSHRYYRTLLCIGLKPEKVGGAHMIHLLKLVAILY